MLTLAELVSCILIILIAIGPVELRPCKVKTLAQHLLEANLPCSEVL
jgi:hypothetical protein